MYTHSPGPFSQIFFASSAKYSSVDLRLFVLNSFLFFFFLDLELCFPSGFICYLLCQLANFFCELVFAFCKEINKNIFPVGAILVCFLAIS